MTSTGNPSGLAELRQTLVAGANAGGGWGYYPNHASRLEPTCWALLALGGSSKTDHRQFLEHSQRKDGLLVEPALAGQNIPNFAFNALAVLMLLDETQGAQGVRRADLLVALAAGKGLVADNVPGFRQNNGIQGWPWIDTTFSWAEPTSLCVLALKKAARAGLLAAGAETRIAEGEKLLIDRSCAAGGWNYGNANAFDQDLRPYISTTALGLLAMQDRRQEPTVRRGLEYLVEHRLSEPSGMALGLTLIALRVFDVPAADVEERLLADWERTRFLGNFHLMAMALCALDSPAAGGAFHV